MELKGYLAEPYYIRASALLNTGLVEGVISFGTDPTDTIRNLSPDILVVGSDHTVEEVMKKGGEFAGRIVIIDRTPGISSSEIYKDKEDATD